MSLRVVAQLTYHIIELGVFDLASAASCRDLVFIWSRLHLRAHPSRQGFLAECLQLASSSTNVRAIFPFIKLVTTEVRMTTQA